MEIIRGRHASFIDSWALAERLAGRASIHIDLGTGDGRFVQHIAESRRDDFAIGVDACRENLRTVSQRAPGNALFVIANAQRLPPELAGLAAQITINFPWGSLLEGLVSGDPDLMAGLVGIASLDAVLEVRLNGGALAEAGWSLEAGGAGVRAALAANGFTMRPPVALTAQDLKACPTTWAKRLAYGRDPRALYLRGRAGF